MVATYFLQVLEKALNYYLALDFVSTKRLTGLEGKVITIHFTAIDFIFQLRILNQKLQIFIGEPYPAEAKVKGMPLSMLSLALSRDKKKRFFLADLVIEGDAELGQQILAIFEQLDIDWEEHLSHIVGDVAAHHVGRFTRGIMAWGKEAKERMLQNTVEYIHEENAWFPPEEAVHDFLQEVDELRMAGDRLEARVNALLEE